MDINTTGIDYESNIDFSTTGLETIDPNIVMSMGEEFAFIAVILNILGLIFYISQTTGLYLINKKLGEKHAWLSFIPLIQIYNYFTASKKSFLYYFVLPILSIIIGVFLLMFTYGISLLLAYVYFIVMWVKLLHAISKRCGRGAWTTVGFFFVPFIMMPIVGYKLDQTNPEQENSQSEKIDEKIEL